MYRTRLSVHDVQDVQDVQDQAERAQGKQGACTSAFRARTVHRGRLCCQCLQRRRPPWTPSCAVHPHQSLLQHSSSATRREREREREIQHSRESERDTALELRNSDKSRERARLEAGRRAVGKLLLQLVLRPYRSVLRQAASPARPAASLRASGDSEHLVHVMHVGASSARSVRPGPCS
jgi:hypothetical protein